MRKTVQYAGDTFDKILYRSCNRFQTLNSITADQHASDFKKAHGTWQATCMSSQSANNFDM